MFVICRHTNTKVSVMFLVPLRGKRRNEWQKKWQSDGQ
ncbi:hypothetical protein JCM19237_3598 [Photobacterium aphoticum]|uniref:Uncharacterized protein n=1 Tax=Photobacterium aphoticum TaxID=754436 RepID=A0A090QPW0_9GAMM|nr:hypothetical protein JCM19237_3598 [Photobacterium aphoticum]